MRDIKKVVIIGLLVINSIALTGCGKEDSKKDRQINTEKVNWDTNISQLMNSLVNVAYTGEIDEELSNKLDDTSKNKLIDLINKHDVSSEIDITDEVEQLKKYKKEEEVRGKEKGTYEDYVKEVKKVLEEKNKVYKEDGDTEQGDIYSSIIYDLYDSDGNKVWEGLDIDNPELATIEQRKEYKKIYDKINNWNISKEEEQEGNAFDLEIMTREEWESMYEGDGSGYTDEMDERIKYDKSNKTYTIELNETDVSNGVIEVIICGKYIDIEVDLTEVTLSMTKGNDDYKAVVVYYEMYDDNTWYVRAVGNSNIIELNGRVDGGKVNVENIEEVFNSINNR